MEAELRRFVDFHQLIVSPHNSLEAREASTGHLAAAFVVMLWMCGPVQCDSEQFRPRVVEKTGVVGNDCGLPIHLIGVCGE